MPAAAAATRCKTNNISSDNNNNIGNNSNRVFSMSAHPVRTLLIALSLSKLTAQSGVHGGVKVL